MEPLVSVIITTYQGMDNLDRAIKSVKNQTYQNIELIVVDDNGKGTEAQTRTEQIVNSYDGIIYIIHETNSNGSVARNTGIKAAKGEYVALLDDDDAYRPEKISLQVSKLLENPERKLCYTGMQIHYPNGNVVTEIQDDTGYLFTEVMLRKIHGQTSTLMFHKEAALSIGGFDESFNRHQDWEFLDRMSYNYEFTVVPVVCLDRYFLTRTRASTPEKFEQNRVFYLEKMKPYIDKLDKEAKKQFYLSHYRSIAKEYLKHKKIIPAVKYLRHCGNPIKVIRDLVHDYQKSTYWRYVK